MRGFLSLEPDAATRLVLAAMQNQLRDALSRQGVSFPERLGATLVAWPFGTTKEIDRAADALAGLTLSRLTLGPLRGRPGDERPSEIGSELQGLDTLVRIIAERIAEPLDPDPPPRPFVRLVRVAPASRKVGIALRASGLMHLEAGVFQGESLGFWRQTPQGFEKCRTMPLSDGGP